MNRIRGSLAAGLLIPALFHAQTRARTFEVASVKLRSGDNGWNFPVCDGNNLQLDPGRFSALNATLYSMIMLAYGVHTAALSSAIRGCSPAARSGYSPTAMTFRRPFPLVRRATQ